MHDKVDNSTNKTGGGVVRAATRKPTPIIFGAGINCTNGVGHPAQAQAFCVVNRVQTSIPCNLRNACECPCPAAVSPSQPFSRVIQRPLAHGGGRTRSAKLISFPRRRLLRPQIPKERGRKLARRRTHRSREDEGKPHGYDVRATQEALPSARTKYYTYEPCVCSPPMHLP